VHQLVIKRFQHCLMHGVTMKFIVTLLRSVSNCHTATVLPPYWLHTSVHADVP